MKLLTKYSRINIITSCLIFLLASVALYILLQLVLLDQVDDDLEIQEHEIEMYVQKFDRLPDAMTMKDQRIYYHSRVEHSNKKTFVSIIAANAAEYEKYGFRQLKFFIAVKENWYEVFVEKSLEETEDISHSIIIIFLATIIAMLIASLVINRLLLRKLWRPFYASLSIMKNFRLGQSKNISFIDTSIDEFKDLNKALLQSIEITEREYQQLKEFTENASHELQTPLAVIRSKLDVLIQDEKLSESQSFLVQGTYEALQKLARLNQSMLLLNKIENRQFTEITDIDINELTEQKLIYFKELLSVKNIVITAKLQQVMIAMNISLAEILLNNLFSNAIKYTPPGGNINITVTEKSLLFTNTAENNSLDKAKLFNRFYKANQASENHGLGLSIVKEICFVSGFSIEYKFISRQHCFEVLFNSLH